MEVSLYSRLRPQLAVLESLKLLGIGGRLTNRALLPISHAPLTCTKVCLARTGVIMVRNERKEGRDNMMKRDQVKRLCGLWEKPHRWLRNMLRRNKVWPQACIHTFRELNIVELSGQLSQTTTLRAEAW